MFDYFIFVIRIDRYISLKNKQLIKLMESSLLEQKSKGVIKCAYVPLDVIRAPSLYDTPDKTYERLETLVRAISSDLPENYREGFTLRIPSGEKVGIAGKIKEKMRFVAVQDHSRVPVIMLTPESEEVAGPSMYTNFDRWDDGDSSQIGVTLSILSCVGISGRKEPVYLGTVDTFFSYPNYEDVRSILHSFEKELMFGSDDALQPLTRRMDVHDNKINDGTETLREIFGKGKRGKMLEMEQGYVFENSYCT